MRGITTEEFQKRIAEAKEKNKEILQKNATCAMQGKYRCSQGGDKWLRFEGVDQGDEHFWAFDKTGINDEDYHPFSHNIQFIVGQKYKYNIWGSVGQDRWEPGRQAFVWAIKEDGREAEIIESIGLDMELLDVRFNDGYGKWLSAAIDELPGLMHAVPGGTCPDGGTAPPDPGGGPDPEPEPEPEAPPPPPPPTVDPIPPGANDGKGNCGLEDGCVPTGTVMGAGDFKDTMELVGSDGHKVTYTRINQLEETPIGDSIPGLHPGIVYDYTLKSDCGVSNDGLVNEDCEIDHKISMDGRRLEMEDMMLEGTQNYTDLILTLDEGVGTFTKSSATTGTLTMADTCAADEAEGEAEGEEDPNITCETSTILSTGYTDPEFFTHAFDPGMIRSVKVINPHDPNGRFLRITIDPHVCDIDSIIDTFCMCTSEDAFGDPIVEFGEMTVTKVNDYTIDVVIVGWIIETHGYEG